MPIEFENDSSEVMNALLREYDTLFHEKVIIAVRYRHTGNLVAYWLKFVTNCAGPAHYTLTIDPDNAQQFSVGEAPRLMAEYTTMLDEVDEFSVEDYKIVRIGEL